MVYFPKSIKKILITGGSGFIGSALVSRLIKDTDIKVYNLDKLGYASQFTIDHQNFKSDRYELLKIDLCDLENTKSAIKLSDPDLVFHLAAETHVDRSINSPNVFLESNIIGTFNLLEGLMVHWQSLSSIRKDYFKVLHVSTDEVFGSLGEQGSFSEKSPYDPRSPYSASKAASDHLVKAFYHTYGLPTLVTNSSNNFGPGQFPEKFIPRVILKAILNQPIPIYGDGKNIRDWIYVEDHIDALLNIILNGKTGESYCIGGGTQKTNEEIVEIICGLLDIVNSFNSPHIRLKTYVNDRPGHDRRYAIDNEKISQQLKWKPKVDFLDAMECTVKWYFENINLYKKYNNLLF